MTAYNEHAWNKTIGIELRIDEKGKAIENDLFLCHLKRNSLLPVYQNEVLNLSVNSLYENQKPN